MFTTDPKSCWLKIFKKKKHINQSQSIVSHCFLSLPEKEKKTDFSLFEILFKKKHPIDSIRRYQLKKSFLTLFLFLWFVLSVLFFCRFPIVVSRVSAILDREWVRNDSEQVSKNYFHRLKTVSFIIENRNKSCIIHLVCVIRPSNDALSCFHALSKW